MSEEAKETGEKMSEEAKETGENRFRPNYGWKKGESGNPLGHAYVHPTITKLARQYTLLAVRTLAEIAANPDAKDAARVAAANALLDRGYGRAPVKVQLEGDDDRVKQFMIAFQEAAQLAHESVVSRPDLPMGAVEVIPPGDESAGGTFADDESLTDNIIEVSRE